MKKLHKIIIISLSITTATLITGCGSSSSPSSSTAENVSNAVENASTTNDNFLSNNNTVDTGTSYDIPPIDASTKQVYLDAINNVRSVSQDCGKYGIKDAAPILTWNEALYRAASEHSEDLAESNTFSHTGSGTQSDWTAQVLDLATGSTMKDRIENNGYTNWSKIGENIAAGSLRDTIQEAIDAWVDSDGHCANLMNPVYKNVAIAHAENDSSAYIHYWTQNFGSN